MQALITLGGGDMRRTLNIFQASGCNAAHHVHVLLQVARRSNVVSLCAWLMREEG